MSRNQKRASSRDYEQRVLTGSRCEPCGGKIDYLDKRSAKLVIRRMKGRQGRLNAYPCPEDGQFFHIGHPPADLTSGDVARAELKPPNLDRRRSS